MNKSYMYNSEVSTRSKINAALGALVGGVPLFVGILWLYQDFSALLAWAFVLWGAFVTIGVFKALVKPSIYWLRFTQDIIEWKGYKKKDKGQVLRKNISKIEIEMGYDFDHILVYLKDGSPKIKIPGYCVFDKDDVFNNLKKYYSEIEISKI